jgi:MraZ protein
VLRGNTPARIDDKGRLKVPTNFRSLIEEGHGKELYVTSIEGTSVLIYPKPVWLDIEKQIAEDESAYLDPSVQKFLERTSFFGAEAEMDSQGRVLIHPLLRESAEMSGEVAVLGQQTYLQVWNHERLRARFANEPYTNEDQRALAERLKRRKA